MRLQTLMQGQQEGVVTMEQGHQHEQLQRRTNMPSKLSPQRRRQAFQKIEKVPEEQKAWDGLRPNHKHRSQLVNEQIDAFNGNLVLIEQGLDAYEHLERVQGSDRDPSRRAEVEPQVERLYQNFETSLVGAMKGHKRGFNLSTDEEGANKATRDASLENLRHVNTQMGDISNNCNYSGYIEAMRKQEKADVQSELVPEP